MELYTIIQGIKGGKNTTKKNGLSVIKCLKNGVNSPVFEFAIDNYTGQGADYKQRTEPLINITFPNGETWSGNIEKLQSELMNPLNQF